MIVCNCTDREKNGPCALFELLRGECERIGSLTLNLFCAQGQYPQHHGEEVAGFGGELSQDPSEKDKSQ